MKKLKFLLFILPFFAFSNVFADTTYDMTSRITSPVNFSECGNGSYTGVELNGATNCWNTNTRNLGTLSRIYFNLPAPTGSEFESDTSYRLSLYMATNDWRNRFGTVAVRPGSSYTNNFVDTFTFVSMKQVNITFTVPYGGSTTYQTLFVDLPATNTNTLITGESNWNLSKVTLTKLTSGSSGGSTTPSGPTTSFDDTAIINNNKENTQDIINNNNTNTQDIINNNNKNFNTITDVLGDCYYNLMEPNEVIASSSNGINYSPVRNYSDDTLEYILVSGTATSNSFYRIFNGTFTTYFDYYIYQNNFPDGVQLYCADSNDNRFYTTIPDNTTINNCYIRVASGTSLNNLKVYPQFSLYQNAPYTPAGIQKCFSKLDDVTGAINNATNQAQQAAQDAINNATNNTNAIINNQNQNNQEQIESQKVCKFIDKSSIKDKDKYIGSDGNVQNLSDIGVTDYLKINSNSDLQMIETYPYNINVACFYDTNKTFLSCITKNSVSLNTPFNIPNTASYVRFNINYSTNRPQFKLCTNGNQAMNDTLTDSNIDNDVGSGFFDDFTSQDFGLSQIITIPLNTIQSLTSKSCVPLQIPIPFTNSNVTLPCMTEIYETKFSTIYNLWKIVSFGIVAYLIAIDIFHIVKGFKDPESDKVEVLDL